MNSKSYFKVGMFVIIGAVLVVTGIIVFGAGKFLKEKIIIESYFDQSVQGLEVGAPLKFQGVKVGNVSEIGFVFNDYDTDLNYVLVRSEIFPDKVGSLKQRENMDLVVKQLIDRGYPINVFVGGDEKDTLQAIIEDDINKGMRIELSSQGVTGVGFLNIVFVDPEQYQPLVIDWTPFDIYIPSKPGVITLLTKAIEDVSKALIDIDFKELGKNMNKILANLAKVDFSQLDVKLQDILNEMDQTVETLNNTTRDMRRFGLSQQTEIKSIISDIKSISSDLNQLLNTGKQDPAWMIFGKPPPRLNYGEEKK
jgi:hypothetical protein